MATNITKEEFEQQKQDAINEWRYVKNILSDDPFYPITGAKLEAMQKLNLRHNWKFGCFLCTLFHDNCWHCPLKGCFKTDSPYYKIEQVQNRTDNDKVKTIVQQCCNEIINAIEKLTYEEVQNGTFDNCDHPIEL